MSSFPRLHKRKSKRHLLRNRTQRSTAIPVRVMPSLVIMGRITTPRRLTLPTGGRANFYISNCGDLRSFQPVGLGQGAAARKEVRDDKKNRDRAVQSDDFQAV